MKPWMIWPMAAVYALFYDARPETWGAYLGALVVAFLALLPPFALGYAAAKNQKPPI